MRAWLRYRVALAITFAVCVGAVPWLYAPAASAAARPLRVAIAADENNLTPWTITGLSRRFFDLLNLIYDPLFWSPNDRANPRPWLAKGYRVSDGGRVWTVSLRPGVEWHDGKPLTAEDVKFTYDYFRQHEDFRFAHHLFMIERVEVRDPLTVVFRLREPWPDFLRIPLADTPIVPRHQWQGVADPAKFADLPVGSGPFRLVEYRRDEYYVLEANPRYFAGAPPVPRLVLPVIKERPAVLLALKSGQIDAASMPVPPEATREFPEGGPVKVLKGTDYLTYAMYFNMVRGPGTQRAFRQAVLAALDLRELRDRVLLGMGEIGRATFVHPSLPWALPDPPPVRDLARAAALLDQLGYRDTNGDGLREQGGQPLTLKFLIAAVDPLQVRAADLVRNQLRQVGIAVDVQSLDPASLSKRTSNRDRSDPGAYDLTVFLWPAHLQTDPDGLRWLLHSQVPFGALKWGYKNGQLDALLDRAARTFDREQRWDLLRQAQRLIREDVPMVVLFYPPALYAFRPEAYDGWRLIPGEGILHKRSFVRGPRR